MSSNAGVSGSEPLAIDRFLADAGLGAYAERLAAFGVDTVGDLGDGDVVTDDDLLGPDINMKKGHLRKLRRALANHDGVEYASPSRRGSAASQ